MSHQGRFNVNYGSWLICINIGSLGFLDSSAVKNPPANARDAGDTGWILRSRGSPGKENDNPLQYSCLGNPMNRGVWRATVQWVTKSQTWLKRLSTHTWWIILRIKFQTLTYWIPISGIFSLCKPFSQFCGNPLAITPEFLCVIFYIGTMY